MLLPHAMAMRHGHGIKTILTESSRLYKRFFKNEIIKSKNDKPFLTSKNGSSLHVRA